MEILKNALLVLHFVGLAAILGGVAVQFGKARLGSPRILPTIMHGAWTQLVTGLALVGVLQATDGEEVNNTKIAVKLGVLIIITVVAFINRKKSSVASWVLPLIGGLTLVNIIVAVFWH